MGVAAGLLLLLYLPGFPYGVADKDPGGYVQHGFAIARSGDFRIHDEALARLPDMTLYGAGARFPGIWIHDAAKAEVVPQFYHLYPATLGFLGRLSGQTAMIDLNGLLAVVSALGVYLVGRRLAGRAAGVVAAAVLALDMVQVWQAKYPTTEISTQLFFVLTVLGLVVAVETRWWPPAALAGAALGIAWLDRPDTLLPVLIALGLLAAAAVLGRFGRLHAAFALGLAVVAPHAVWQALGPAGRYSQAAGGITAGRLALAGAGLALGTVVGRVLWRGPLGRWAEGLAGRLVADGRRRLALKALLPAGLTLLALVAWLRPQLFGVDYFDYNGRLIRSYDEQNLRRLAWFVTVPGIAATLAGFAVVALRRGRAGRRRRGRRHRAGAEPAAGQAPRVQRVVRRVGPDRRRRRGPPGRVRVGPAPHLLRHHAAVRRPGVAAARPALGDPAARRQPRRPGTDRARLPRPAGVPGHRRGRPAATAAPGRPAPGGRVPRPDAVLAGVRHHPALARRRCRRQGRDLVARRLLASLRLVGLDDDAVRADRLRLHQAQGGRLASLLEQALPTAQDDGEDHQPVLVDQVVLHQRADELGAAGHQDVAAVPLLEPGDLVDDVVPDHGRVVPLGLVQRGRHDVLGHAVHLLAELAGVGHGRPGGGEPLVGHASQEEGVGRQRLVELELGAIVPLLELEGPASVLEGLRSTRVLHHAVQAHELRHDDLAHAAPPCRLSGAESQPSARCSAMRSKKPDHPCSARGYSSAKRCPPPWWKTISVLPSPSSVRTTVTTSASSPGWSEMVKTSHSGATTSW